MSEYGNKLKLQQWRAKRTDIILRNHQQCNDCGEFFVGAKGLEAHHCWYEHDKEPWDYPDECFLVLCRKCHGERQKVQNSAQVVLGMYMRLLSVEEMKILTMELVAKRQDLERGVKIEL